MVCKHLLTFLTYPTYEGQRQLKDLYPPAPQPLTEPVPPSHKPKYASKAGYNARRRKCGRVVDCTGLENRRPERVREFESHRFRQLPAQVVSATWAFSFGLCPINHRSLFQRITFSEID